MKTKIIPFDLEMAKKIQAGEIEGKIVRNGCEVVILGYNSEKYPKGYPIRIAYLNKGGVDYVTHEGLHIEVPRDEPQFKPFDKVLVRQCNYRTPDDYEDATWLASLYSNKCVCDTHKIITGKIFKQCIPYEGNEHLVGTTDDPKEE